METDNKYIKLENTTPFQVLVVSPNKMEHIDWTTPNYLKTLLSESYCRYETINPSEYIDKLSILLEMEKYTYVDVKVHVISENIDSIFEIMYIDLLPEFKVTENLNDFATLLNIDGNIINGCAIITKTEMPSINGLEKCNMWYGDVTKDNIEKLLFTRANTSAIIYDADEESYQEIPIFGTMETFAETFFGESQYTYKKLELGFLKHNLNIWYSENKYGCLDVFGDILPDLSRIDKMIVFTMWTETYRHNLTIDEFNKIKYLSKKINRLEWYDIMVTEQIDNEEKDHLNRLIIKNKYILLNYFYDKYK